MTKYSADDMKLAKWILKQVEVNYPDIKINIDQWADDIRKLTTIDCKTHNEIELLWEWAMNYEGSDGFTWWENLRSPAKLRKRKDGVTYFDSLTVKMKKDQGNGKGRRHNRETASDRARRHAQTIFARHGETDSAGVQPDDRPFW